MKSITKNIYLFTAVKLGVAAMDIYILKKLYKKNKPLAWVLSIAANFAMSYADQTNRDYQQLVDTVDAGRIAAETGI